LKEKKISIENIDKKQPMLESAKWINMEKEGFVEHKD